MKVNIIMPAYNGHETIRQAISSVASQDGLTWFCGKSMDFWNRIPDELREGVNEGYLTVDFYQSDAMKELADRNIVPTLTFHQFYEMLNQ